MRRVRMSATTALTALTVLRSIQNGLLTSLFGIKRYSFWSRHVSYTSALFLVFINTNHIIILTWQYVLSATSGRLCTCTRTSPQAIFQRATCEGLLHQFWWLCVLWTDYMYMHMCAHTCVHMWRVCTCTCAHVYVRVCTCVHTRYGYIPIYHYLPIKFT
jgi:hypothetical protein